MFFLFGQGSFDLALNFLLWCGRGSILNDWSRCILRKDDISLRIIVSCVLPVLASIDRYHASIAYYDVLRYSERCAMVADFPTRVPLLERGFWAIMPLPTISWPL